MAAYPEPEQVFSCFNRQGAIVDSYTDRPIPSDLLKMERWMLGVLFKDLVIPIGNLLGRNRKRFVQFPK